jgi:hypothetical protein
MLSRGGIGERGQRRASRTYLIGRRSGRGCCTLEEQRMRYMAQPHAWKLPELESMKTLSLSLWGLRLWEAANHHKRQAGMPH